MSRLGFELSHSLQGIISRPGKDTYDHANQCQSQRNDDSRQGEPFQSTLRGSFQRHLEKESSQTSLLERSIGVDNQGGRKPAQPMQGLPCHCLRGPFDKTFVGRFPKARKRMPSFDFFECFLPRQALLYE